MPAYNVQAALQAGMTPEEISAYMTQNKLKPLQNLSSAPKKKKKSGLLDLLSVGTSIGGGILGSPLGPLGVIGGSAIGGGVGQLIENLIGGGNGADLKDVGKEAAISGVGGGLGLGVGRLLGGVGVKAGGSLIRGGTIAGKSTLGRFSEQQALQDVAREQLGNKGLLKFLGTSGASKFQKVEPAIGKLTNQVDDLLKGVKTSTPRTSLDMKAQSLLDEMDNTTEQKAFQTLYNKAFKQVFNGKIPQDMTPYDINKLRRAFNSQATKAYGGLKDGAVLSKPNQAILDLIDFTDDFMADLVPGVERETVRGLNKQASTLIKGIPEFKKLSEEGLNIFGANIQTPSRLLQVASDTTGRALTGAGGDGITSKSLQGLLGQASARAFAPSTYQNEPMDQGMGQSMEQPDIQSLIAQAGPTQADTGMPSNNTTQEPDKSELLKQMAILDMANGGKNVTKLLALSKAFEKPKVGEAQASQISQIQAAAGLVDELESTFLQAEGAGQTGFITGPASGVAGNITGGLTGKEAYLYNSARKGFTALIARATGERGVLTDADAARALELLPKLNDQPDVAVDKLNRIRRIFADAETRLSIPRGSAESTDTLLTDEEL